jgi:hypothetical protein
MNKFFRLFFFFCIKIVAQDSLSIQPEETPYLLLKGKTQLENSFGYRKENQSSKAIILPSVLAKYGLTDKFELRVTLENQIAKADNETFSGLVAPILGFKTKLWKEKGLLPEASLISQVGIPKIGAKAFQLEKWAPDFQVMMQGNYGKYISMNYNFGSRWDGFENNPFYTYKATLSVMPDAVWTLYSDIFGHIHQQEDSHQSLGFGIMYQFTNDLIVDWSNGVGLNEFAPDFSSTIILSVRF